MVASKNNEEKTKLVKAALEGNEKRLQVVQSQC